MKTLIALALAALLMAGCRSEPTAWQFTVIGINPSGMTYKLRDGQIKYIYLRGAPDLSSLVKPGDEVELRFWDGFDFDQFESIKVIRAEQQ